MRAPLALTALLATAVLASFSPGTGTAVTGGGPTSPRMLAALERVRADELRADVHFIASDDLAGRDTPSEGLRVAARFLRARLEELGWKPGAKDGWFYTYELEHKLLDEAASEVTWEAKGATETLKFGVDYFVPSLLDVMECSTSAPVVFAGEGSKDDFGSARVQGKWALVFDGGDEVRDMARNARKAKAKGLIVAPGPSYKGEGYAQRYAAALERQRRGSVAWPSKRDADEDERADGSGERAPREPFPTIVMTRDAVARMLGAATKATTPAKGADLGLKLSEARRLVGDQGRIQVENVCGYWPGSDPALAKEIVIVSAHYDHVGMQGGQIHNGADDNGSGTCGLLAMAKALAAHGPLKRSVMLMWVSGEEKGLWGSRAFSEKPWFPDGGKPIANINIDMIGRNAPDQLLVTPTKKREKDYNALVKLAERLAPEEGFPKLGSADQYYERSDHFMFAKLGIPVMFLFSDVHADYHQPGDDPEKLDYDKVRRASRLVLRVLDGLQDDKLELK